MTQAELDIELMKECCKETVDFNAIEALLQAGANPLRYIPDEEETVYSEINFSREYDSDDDQTLR